MNTTPAIFFFGIAGTVVLTRISLHTADFFRLKLGNRSLVPRPVILGFRIHHYVYGLALAALAIVLGQILLLAIGIGLVADELWFIVGLQGDDQKYLSPSSAIGAVVALAVIFVIRYQILSFAINMLYPVSKTLLAR